jgi:xylan 1,4-beta-xylosidase
VWARALCILPFALTACSEPRAPSADVVRISVDATAFGTELKRVWAFHGFDELNYLTEPAGRELLGELVDAHSAPVYVRNHFWLNTGDGAPAPKWGSTNVYTEGLDGTPHYDWRLTDGLLDALTDAGARPIVELGFMPEALSSRPQPYQNSSTRLLNSGCFFPPRDYEKWGALVRAWATHANDRYPDAVSHWLWELWNEPDSAYWHGTFDEYARLYDTTEAALHGVLPNAVLGGPAVIDADGEFLPRFLEHCASSGRRLDAVTFHAKGGTAFVDGAVELDLGHQLRLHRAGFEAVASFPTFARAPIYITEADPDGCAACLPEEIPGAAYRLSPAYGAYEVAMMKRSLELEADAGVDLRGVLAWAFTFPDAPYMAGYRELASHGVQLPVLGAFQLLGRLAGQRLPVHSSGAQPLARVLASSVRDQPDVDALATRDGTTVQVLVWNYHDRIAPSPGALVQLSIRVPPGFGASVRVGELRVDETHGNAPALWVDQGAPAAPSTAQVGELEGGMFPAPLRDEAFAVPADGVVLVSLELPRFGISLVTVEPEAP